VIIADFGAIPVSAPPIRGSLLRMFFFSATAIKILNLLQNENFPKKSSTANPSKLYFCLDTALKRTLAYAHWCNWGNDLKIVNICSHSRFHGGMLSAACAMIPHRISPSFKCPSPVRNSAPIVVETFFAATRYSRVWAGAAQAS
jgi:hypothetical protein